MPIIRRSISVAALKDAYQSELLDILNAHDSPKAIYWERSAIAPVNLVIGHSILKERGVCHSYVIDDKTMAQSPPGVKTVFFVIRSDLKVVDAIRTFLNSEVSKTRIPVIIYCIIAIPSLSLVCRTFLREMKIFDKITSIYELPLNLLPLDTDILSMEDTNCFADFSLREKEDCIYNLARGLMKFQSIFGLFPRIRAKGPKAKRVASMLVQMRQEEETAASLSLPDNSIQPPKSHGQTKLLIIVDRSVDLLTPCLGQITYEGLINEVWPTNYGSLKLNSGNDKNASDTKRVLLNSTDPLFNEIRDQNLSVVASTLSRRTKELSAVINETKTSKELTTLKRVVGQLPELCQLHASAALHMNIAERLQDYAGTEEFLSNFRTQQDFLADNETDKAHPFIEQQILRLAPIEEVLRLICIQSFCNGGLKQRLLDFYKHQILEMYGHEHMLSLDNLERIGLLEESSRVAAIVGLLPAASSNPSERESLGSSLRVSENGSCSVVKRTVVTISSAYRTSLRRSLRLQAPADSKTLDGGLGVIFSGYVPISVRLVQALAFGWPTQKLSSNTGSSSALLGMTAMGNAASNLATSALQAGRRIVSGSPQQRPTVSSSCDGNYVTSLLHTVEVDEIQSPNEVPEVNIYGDKMSSKDGLSDCSKTVVVTFVGGVTHSEVAALRKLSSNVDGRLNFIIVTTGFLTWRSLFQSLAEPIKIAELSN